VKFDVNDIKLTIGGMDAVVIAAPDPVLKNITHKVALDLVTPSSIKTGPHMYSAECHCDSCSKWHEPPVRRTLDVRLMVQEISGGAPVSLPASWLLELCERASSPRESLRAACLDAIDAARVGKLPWDPVDPAVTVDCGVLLSLLEDVEATERPEGVDRWFREAVAKRTGAIRPCLCAP
jgi:hypothetical protein